MAAKRQVTNKLRTQYHKASKADKSMILGRVVATTGMGRSTARRMLTGPKLPDPARPGRWAHAAGGEFARTLTMTDLVTGSTENCSIRNNAAKWITEGIDQLQQWFPFAMAISTRTGAVSSSTTGSSRGCRPATSSRPARGRTRKTTRYTWSPRTTTWCANRRSTGATTPRRSWKSGQHPDRDAQFRDLNDRVRSSSRSPAGSIPQP
jgi:hypothetical protein